METPVATIVPLDKRVFRVELNGYVDAHTATQLDDLFQQAINEQKYCFVVDCTKLTYISSAGLGVFMAHIEQVRCNGGDIKLCGVSEPIKQIMEILGFPVIFDIVSSWQEAYARFTQSPSSR